MLGSAIFQCPSTTTAAIFDCSSKRINRYKYNNVVCNAERSNASIPKLEPFSRSRTDRRIQEPEPSFLKKCEDDLTDYCSTLEGDDSYSCWRAYFELKDLEKEMPKEDVEKFVRQTGGRKSLISCLHGITALDKKAKSKQKSILTNQEAAAQSKPFPVPDGLPRTKEEIEEEEKAKMPDSPFTTMLRRMGRHPAWYSEAPDHETD